MSILKTSANQTTLASRRFFAVAKTFTHCFFDSDYVRKVNCTLQCADSCEQLSFSEHPKVAQTADFSPQNTQRLFDLIML